MKEGISDHCDVGETAQVDIAEGCATCHEAMTSVSNIEECGEVNGPKAVVEGHED